MLGKRKVILFRLADILSPRLREEGVGENRKLSGAVCHVQSENIFH